MQDTIRGMRSKRAEGDTGSTFQNWVPRPGKRATRSRFEKDSGFTMIELLVVVVIIGVLVAIAVPVYLNYRKGAANKSAASDVRAAVSAVEQYYTENGNSYPAGPTLTATYPTELDFPAPTGTPQKATLSPQNTLTYRAVVTGGTVTSYTLCGRNADGGDYYKYDSAAGGSVKKVAAADCS